MEIISQEPQSRTREDNGNEGRSNALIDKSDAKYGNGDNESGSGRETIQSIQKVQGVRDCHHPENGYGDRPNPELKVPKGKGDALNLEGRKRNDESRDDLKEELMAGRKAAKVVYRSHAENDGPGEK